MPDYERRGDELRWRGIGYQKGAGYVGLGEVVAKAVPVKDFKIGETGTILDAELDQPGLKKNSDDAKKCEWLAAVRWIQTVSVSDAYTMPGIFANQNVVCRLRDAATLTFLKETLGPAAP